MGEDSSVVQHLRAGQDRLARVGAAVEAFRRLSPEDYGYFLATIETELSARGPKLRGGATTLLLAAASTAEPRANGAPGTLREAVLGLLADGQARSTSQIREELEARRPVKRATLNTEIFTLRKNGLLRSEGQGRGRRHTLASAPASSQRGATPSKREPTTRGPRRKSSDDEDRPERVRQERSPDAEQIYAHAIGPHHLLSKEEELELARRLEATEMALWERLLAGPRGNAAREHLRALDPPVDATTATQARAADLDRLIAARVIAALDRDLHNPAIPESAALRLRSERAALRALEAESDRIRERFAACNLRLVPSTIRSRGYHNTTNLSMGDLIQEGNLGLLRAIPRFDYRRGLRFSTFAPFHHDRKVRTMRVELTRVLPHRALNSACLPFHHVRMIQFSSANGESRTRTSVMPRRV